MENYPNFNAINDCDWTTLRLNNNEKLGNPKLSFDAIINSKIYGEVIVEYTRIYPSNNLEPLRKTKNGKNIQTNQEIAQLRNNELDFLDSTRNSSSFSKEDLIRSICDAVTKKSAKKYANNIQPKILILEVETLLFNMMLHKSFSTFKDGNLYINLQDFFNIIFLEVFIKLNTINKFDEIILISYANQLKEESYFIRAKKILNPSKISEKSIKK